MYAVSLPVHKRHGDSLKSFCPVKAMIGQLEQLAFRTCWGNAAAQHCSRCGSALAGSDEYVQDKERESNQATLNSAARCT